VINCSLLGGEDMADNSKKGVENVVDYLKSQYPESNEVKPIVVDDRKATIFVVEDEDGKEVWRSRPVPHYELELVKNDEQIELMFPLR